MPDAQGKLKADGPTETPLHAYKLGAETHQDDVIGDPTGRDVLNASKDADQDPEKD